VYRDRRLEGQILRAARTAAIDIVLEEVEDFRSSAVLPRGGVADQVSVFECERVGQDIASYFGFVTVDGIFCARAEGAAATRIVATANVVIMFRGPLTG
jgi:hypothetical protein